VQYNTPHSLIYSLMAAQL